MNATYSNILKYGRAKFGNVSDYKLEKLIVDAANIPKRSLNNFQRREPPKEHHYLHAIAAVLGVPTDLVTVGSLNEGPVTSRHGRREVRRKYSGLGKLVKKAETELKLTTKAFSSLTHIPAHALDSMKSVNLTNESNLFKLLDTLKLPRDYFEKELKMTDSKQEKASRNPRKVYWGLAKLIDEAQINLDMSARAMAISLDIPPEALRKMKSKQLSNVPNLEKLLKGLNLPTNYLDAKVRAARNGRNGLSPIMAVSKLTPAVGSNKPIVIEDSEMTVNEVRDGIVKNFILTINNNQISGEHTMSMLTDDAEVIAREILIARGIDPNLILAGKAFAKAFSR